MSLVNAMSNPQLDQFSSALWWKIVPWLILGGGVATFGGVFVKWLERRATRFGRDRRNAKNLRNKSSNDAAEQAKR